MARLVNHGGYCCGMRHIYGFDGNDQANANSLLNNTSGSSDSNLQLEVILSENQTRDNPQLIAELARLGYVYTSAWSGQHGTPVHLFLRAKRRLALTDANFYNRWVNELNGMLPHPALAGILPSMRDEIASRQQRPNRQRRPRYNVRGFAEGDQVRVINTRSMFYNQVVRIERIYLGDVNYMATIDRGRAGRRANLALSSLALVQAQPEQPPAPEIYAPDYRHPDADQVTFIPERRLILSQFYCIFRETGAPSRVFSSLLEGQEAFPHALDWHERRVYSDGEIVEGPVHHG